MTTMVKAAALGSAVGITLLGAPQARADDATVAAKLGAVGLNYEIDADGDFKVLYNYAEEGRTQLVFVSGGTETVADLTIREVFSPAARIDKDAIDGTKALELMRHSGEVKLGAWEIRGDVLYFVIKVFDQLAAKELEAAMDIAAETADEMEISLTGGGDDL